MSKRGSFSFNSGMYFVIGSSTPVISPSSMAIPINAEVTDFATEKDVSMDSL
ncbi:MAG TPA: hypothetical protein VFR94_17570 [Nitrososphaeraceae archaeon]|nr:hypothetical protein [Nitrososphaeraceae archaeon]